MVLSDVFTPEKRSQIMARISGKNTKPEIAVRKLVHSLGFRFRIHDSKLPGKPDIVLSRHRKIIFVNGCFWHGHSGCSRSKIPHTNPIFWKDKISKNIIRDERIRRKLRREGWRTMTVWQCEMGDTEKLTQRIARYLKNRC